MSISLNSAYSDRKIPLGFNTFIEKYFISIQQFLDVNYIYNDYKFGGHTNK